MNKYSWNQMRCGNFQGRSAAESLDFSPVQRHWAQRQKHSLHRRWMRGIKRGDPTSRYLYIKDRNRVKGLILKTNKLYEKGIALKSKTNPT